MLLANFRYDGPGRPQISSTHACSSLTQNEIVIRYQKVRILLRYLLQDVALLLAEEADV